MAERKVALIEISQLGLPGQVTALAVEFNRGVVRALGSYGFRRRITGASAGRLEKILAHRLVEIDEVSIQQRDSHISLLADVSRLRGMRGEL